MVESGEREKVRQVFLYRKFVFNPNKPLAEIQESGKTNTREEPMLVDENKYALLEAPFNEVKNAIGNNTPIPAAEPDSETIDWNGLIHAFGEFIKTQVAKKTAENYYSSAKNILLKYTDEWTEAQSRFSGKIETAEGFFDLLLANPKYVKSNKLGHNQHNAAFRWFLHFLGGNPESIATLHKEKTAPYKPTQQQVGGVIDWNDLPNLSKVKPAKLVTCFSGEAKEIQTKNWTELLCAFYGIIASEHPDMDLTTVKSNNSKRKLCSYNPDEVIDHFTSRKKLQNGLYIDTNFSANDIIRICYNLMRLANTAFDKVTIYLRDGDSVQGDAEEAVSDDETAEMVLTEQEERVLLIFKDNFQRGMRLQFRDLMMLKNVYESAFGEGLSLTDDEIMELLKNNGFETEPNKFSHIDNLLCGTTVTEIEAFIAEQNEIGAKRIWIEPLYNHFRDKLGLAVSAELLVQIILKLGKRKYRKDDYYGFVSYSSTALDGQKDEMCQAVAKLLEYEATPLTLDEIQRKLPAYPLFNSIKGLNLGNSPDVIELHKGTFAHIDCVYITDEEVAETEKIIESEMNETGQVECDSVQTKLKENLPSIFENNETFGDAGIWKAITARLADDFIFNWQIQRQRV
jgi:hypothetical protein